MLTESLMALAALAGNTVVVAATTDAWETARGKFARLLGRGDPKQIQPLLRQLEETRHQLTGPAGADLERARAALTKRWAGQVADLLEEHPGAEAELRALVEEIETALPAGAVVAIDHSMAAGRDVNIFQYAAEDPYTKTVEQLGSDKLDVRIGGIYALERVARDSKRDHPTVMEVLAAYVREHSREQWPPR